MQLSKSCRLLLISAIAVVLGTSGLAPSAEAVSFRVSQESSAGAGDFDANVLGSIDAFATGLTTSAFYQYDSLNAASYNGELNGGPNPVSNLSQVFLVDAADGLSLVVVHDSPNDGSGGSTQTRWNLMGDTAAQVLADDPSESVLVSAGGTQFDSTRFWIACCTDGYAIGSLDGNWSMLGQFVAAPTGITSWAAVSNDFSTIPLTLDVGRRVRLDVAAAVPEPSSMLLLGSGLAGLAGWRWRQARLPHAS